MKLYNVNRVDKNLIIVLFYTRNLINRRKSYFFSSNLCMFYKYTIYFVRSFLYHLMLFLCFYINLFR